MKNKKVLVRNAYGWKLYKRGPIKLWFSGYLTEKKSINQLLLELYNFSRDDRININDLSRWARKISGHFAFIVYIEDFWCFSVVDKVCSIPLYELKGGEEYKVSNYAPYLKNSNSNFDIQSILELSMSGFVLGRNTIYENISRFSPGECSLWIDGNLYRRYYYTYITYGHMQCNVLELKNRLTKVFLSVLKKSIESVENRQIVVPLSAGNDSRLIASGLRELGYDNVVCFSYGRKGNFEVITSQKVATRLGYKWIYIQDNLRLKRLFFLSEEYKNYVDAFDSYASIPNVQDVYEVFRLKSNKEIDDDAIIINGSCGDFISGGHIPEKINLEDEILSVNDFDWGLFLEKHYSLWRKLRSGKNDKIIIRQLNKIATERFDVENNKIFSYALMEAMEFVGRQSRYVINQQRAYDFFGYEWRMPLWDEEFLNFWESVPPQYKVGKKLYKEVLIDNNWGGVWRDIEVNNKLIRPYFLLILRFIMKLIMAPFGKKNWHRLEKRFFAYWLHPSYAQAVTRYRDVVFDRKGYRNPSSWLANQYVKKNGFNDVLEVSIRASSIYDKKKY